MDLQEQFRRRIDEQQVADVLACIARQPGKRSEPLEGDVAGAFDFWFDGGAGKVQTGYIEYEFADGTRATVGAPIPALSVTIQFPNGCTAHLQQTSWGSAG